MYSLTIFFKLSGASNNTVVDCLIDEMEGLQDFHSKQNTLSLKDSGTIIGLLRHCLLHDTVAEKLIKAKQCVNKILVDGVDEMLNIHDWWAKSTDIDVDVLKKQDPIGLVWRNIQLHILNYLEDLENGWKTNCHRL